MRALRGELPAPGRQGAERSADRRQLRRRQDHVPVRLPVRRRGPAARRAEAGHHAGDAQHGRQRQRSVRHRDRGVCGPAG